MTPAAIFTTVKDVVVLGVVLWAVWFVYERGEDSVKAADVKALQAQVAENTKTVADWQKQKDDTDAKLAGDVRAINDRPPGRPVWVSVPAGGGRVPAVPGPAKDDGAGAGAGVCGDRPGGGQAAVDRGPAIDAEEKRLETVMAECRDMQQKWVDYTSKKGVAK